MPERGMWGISARCVVFDIETTGLFPEKRHRIIEIAAVALVANGSDEEFQSLINAGKPVPKAAQGIPGMENDGPPLRLGPNTAITENEARHCEGL